jgi:NhaP-type Na+/H+ or K+/H+ antiporter
MQGGQIMVILAGAICVCVLCQWLAWRVNLPAIIFLLAAGIVAGPVLGMFDPELLLGDLFFPFIQLSVAIILFEGSLTLKFRQIMGLGAVVRNMLSVGLLATWLVSTVAAKLFAGVGWEIAFLFGAITVVTGPTVIAPLLRVVRPTPAVANILRWEGIVIDPIGVALAVLVFEFILAETIQQAWSQIFLVFGQIVLAGMVVGGGAGYLFGLVLRHRILPGFLQNVATLAVIFAAFVGADQLQHESGLVAVTVLGMWLGNMRGVYLEEILHFKESLSILLISLLFLVLTVRLDVAAIAELGGGALLIFIAVQAVGRPLNVFVSTIGSQLSYAERIFLAWIAPRGIVAAAISSLFAIRLLEAGYGDARLLAPLTFTIIIGTVLLQSFTALPLARWLKVAEPEPRGFLIIGANLVARSIGRALRENGVRVLLVDSGWEKLNRAEALGLEVYQGSPISEPADRHMVLAGIGRMLGLAPYESINIAAAAHYRNELGRENIYLLPARDDDELEGPVVDKSAVHGAALFGGAYTYGGLEAILRMGGVLQTQRIEHPEDVKQFGQKGKMVLFFIDPKGRVLVNGKGASPSLSPGWSVICLHTASSEKKWSRYE